MDKFFHTRFRCAPGHVPCLCSNFTPDFISMSCRLPKRPSPNPPETRQEEPSRFVRHAGGRTANNLACTTADVTELHRQDLNGSKSSRKKKKKKDYRKLAGPQSNDANGTNRNHPSAKECKCGKRPIWLAHMSSLLVSDTGKRAWGKWKLGQINKDKIEKSGISTTG